MPWTPTAAGQTLTAAKVEDLASYAVPVQAAKAGDTSRNTTATAAADPDLVLVLPANRTYVVEAVLHVSSAANAAGDFRVSYSWTNTATVYVSGHALVNTLASGTTGDLEAVAQAADSTSPSADVNYGASTSRNTVTVWARVTTGGSNVTLTLQWAQQTSNANNTTLHAGSQLTAHRVA